MGGNLPPTIVFRNEDQLAETDLRSAIEAVVTLSAKFDCYRIYQDRGKGKSRRCEPWSLKA